MFVLATMKRFENEKRAYICYIWVIVVDEICTKTIHWLN